uniref:Essential protein Yae1 N-terminal domain-containing protein n=1 Tax=Fibrocapsa japonica TaxID=94617 RepID=A0A7S2V746_9STRA|mmetsp:Transcript_5918/g.8954  ORF Transcript_5918/g.8954 Transcript_5918/m.8954 type:complete len:151 (+) Transcript_5918:106-558(+)|eukprot:CAMPEP_0113944632 /NCGR_PEP_ID=MMETSP1339-20121228/35044_1 /TAXON_ID=94617 /ORGANISM="Fibrocapsa japonica" /LENGTH=150 /DNA_ID=CAMNT_0000949907 /DNA_START=71 /DNA_END=523 /DNA_ORIENTATION=+ /assembly_acc=CAM_ASM_000762
MAALLNSEVSLPDIFDDVLNLESKWVSSGVEQGCIDGRDQGIAEGKLLGSKVGRKMGEELGFYDGFCNTWLVIAELFPGTVDRRALRSLESMQEKLAEIPAENVEGVDFEGKIQLVRAKFKVVNSLLKTNVKYQPQIQEQVQQPPADFSF